MDTIVDSIVVRIFVNYLISTEKYFCSFLPRNAFVST